MQKKILAVFIFIIPALFTPPCVSAEKNPPEESQLTLKSTILQAYAGNKDIQMQEKEIDAAKANIIDATSNFLPQVDVGGSYTYNNKVLTENIFSGYHNDHIVGASLSETIYNGGADIANFKQSQLNLRVQQETLRARKLDVEFDAKRLYYGLLLAYENARIAQDMVGQAEAHYHDVDNMFKEGTASRFDALQSKVQVSLLMPDLVRARNDIDLIKAQINKLLSVNIDRAVDPIEKLGYTPVEIKEAEFLRQAYMNKPEMILQALGIDISKWSIEMAKSGAGPDISANGEYYYRSSDPRHDMFNSGHENWYMGISVSLPVFDGFSTIAKISQAKALYAKSILNKDNVVDQIAVDIRQACLDLKKAQQLIDSQKDNIEEAKEALKISEISYASGVGINLDVLDSQVALAKIERNLAEGMYDYLMAQANLERSMGKSYIAEEKNVKGQT